MSEIELFQRFALALAIGFLLGLERSWSGGKDESGAQTAGLRTFSLSSLLGAVAAATSLRVGGVFLAAAFLVFGAALAAFYWRARVEEDDYGATSLVAVLLAFTLGAYAVLGDMRMAASSAIVATGLLAFKAPLHAWLHRITREEIRSALILLAMTFILLPLFPSEPMDPWGALNLREAWLLAILIAAISFAGYLALRLFGERFGLAAAGLTGGLASSTATTVSFGRMARQEACPEPLASAAILAGGTALFRVTALGSALHPPLLAPLLPPLGAGGLAVIGFGLWRLRNSSRRGEDGLTLRNPFELGTVLAFAAVLALLVAAARLMLSRFGEDSLIALGALTGLVNDNVITLAAARLTGQGLSDAVAANAILAGAAAGLVARAGIGWFIAGRRFGAPLAIGAILGIGVGVAAVALG